MIASSVPESSPTGSAEPGQAAHPLLALLRRWRSALLVARPAGLVTWGSPAALPPRSMSRPARPDPADCLRASGYVQGRPLAAFPRPGAAVLLRNPWLDTSKWRALPDRFGSR